MRSLEDVEKPASVVQKSLEFTLYRYTLGVGLLSSFLEDVFLGNIAWKAQANLP